MITHQKKHKIQHDLQEYVESKGSQNKAANTLKGVSSATISQVINNNWDLIHDSMWNKISSQIGSNMDSWEFVQTQNANKLFHVFKDSKEYSLVMPIIGNEGTGKTETTKQYAFNTPNVYHLNCNEYWDRRWFLKELLKTMGRNPAGMLMPEMMEEAVSELKKQENPQIILDEGDKLKDQVLYFFITLYNRLEGDCSMVLMATPYLKKRIMRGLSLNKKGYREIYSRLGKRFIELDGVNFKDVVLLCSANGVTDKAAIKKIYEDCDHDIRRIKRLVHAYKRSQENNA